MTRQGDMWRNVEKKLAAKDAEIDALTARVKELEEDAKAHDALFDLRWKADMRAINRWHEAGGDSLTWPDHADLCVWLMEQNIAAEDENARLRDALAYMVNFYDEGTPLRTADVHPADCTCTRCVVDGFRDALKRGEE